MFISFGDMVYVCMVWCVARCSAEQLQVVKLQDWYRVKMNDVITCGGGR